LNLLIPLVRQLLWLPLILSGQKHLRRQLHLLHPSCLLSLSGLLLRWSQLLLLIL
jgi:hypothetical protein